MPKTTWIAAKPPRMPMTGIPTTQNAKAIPNAMRVTRSVSDRGSIESCLRTSAPLSLPIQPIHSDR